LAAIDKKWKFKGRQESALPGVHCIKVSRPGTRTKNHWSACVGIVLQGSKEIVLGREVYRCEQGSLNVTSVDLPVISRVSAAYYSNSICRFVHSGSRLHIFSIAINRLKSELGEPLDVAALANTARMSRSAFFRHFKEVTAMSPIQYQKRLRMARRPALNGGRGFERGSGRVPSRTPECFAV
jgi:hypothetical protein